MQMLYKYFAFILITGTITILDISSFISHLPLKWNVIKKESTAGNMFSKQTEC